MPLRVLNEFQSFCVNGFLWKFRPKAVVAKEVWFQSFCVNGFLWKNRGANCGIYESYCFNPSVSMDSSGSLKVFQNITTKQTGFQSFCVNGFLWKALFNDLLHVSILLCQWIPLEVMADTFQSLCQWIPLEDTGSKIRQSGKDRVSILLCQWIPLEDEFFIFNPSVSMDSSGSFTMASLSVEL